MNKPVPQNYITNAGNNEGNQINLCILDYFITIHITGTKTFLDFRAERNIIIKIKSL